jgi:protein kinase-like protein
VHERFEQEARAVAALNHPHICTLHDVGHQDGVDFLVMEYLNGETLAARLARGPVPLDQALVYASQIADAMDVAHRQGITHRDLKPANVMLGKSGVKLLDFGLAKLRPVEASGAALSGPTAAPMTEAGAIVGTIEYMAPEQLEGREADSRSDIFAFGLVMFEMVTGRKAFDAKTRPRLIHAIIGIDPPPISSIASKSPHVLDRLVTRCLKKDPDDRWQSAADVKHAIEWIRDAGAVDAPHRRQWDGLASARVAWSAAALLAIALIATPLFNSFAGSLAGPGAHPLKVAVFFPDPKRSGPAYEDGAIQQSGFQTAYDEYAQHTASAEQPAWNPYLLPSDSGNVSLRDQLLPRMQTLYKAGYRVFVITMSAAALELRPVFEQWRRQLGTDLPVLISTVSSAPNIANRKEGILRFYIRSEEEASELARYAAWKQDVRRLGVFYVTDSAQRPNPYGYGGLMAVSHEFEKDLERTVEPHPVLANGADATAEVAKFVAAASGRDVGAFVIGYDTMLKETLKALISSRFSGPILTSSTLTEMRWQPEDNSRDSQIYTVTPHRDTRGRPQAENGVVFLFSKLTLASTLKCASRSSDTRSFVDCWEGDTSESGGFVGVTHLSDGDTIVPVLVTNQWRIQSAR